MRTDKIYLVGFMAAGKTTVARALGARLGWAAEDVDERIEARERMAVADIFARRGEAYFRAVEQAVLLGLLGPRHLVVATGGGTFSDPVNRAAINQDGMSVWLDVPLDELLARLPVDGRRPLAASLSEFETLYTMRRSAYQQAHLRIDASRAPAAELVERVLDSLGY
ncbi:MAG: shikimate kinase [Bacteroidales bacterium]